MTDQQIVIGAIEKAGVIIAEHIDHCSGSVASVAELLKRRDEWDRHDF